METDIDKIEAYLSGEMTGADRQSFEAEMAERPELADEVDLCRLAREAVELSIGDQLRQQMQQWQQEEAGADKNRTAKVVKMAPRQSMRRVLAIAASVMLLLAAGTFWYANSNFDSGKMALGFYEELDLRTLRSNAPATDPLAQPKADIEAGSFAAADAFLENVSPANGSYPDARFLLAHSFYRQGRSSDAINILQELIDAPDGLLKDEAEWLTVLSYLQMNETEDTDFQELLTAIAANPDHSYYRKAQQLQEKLHSFWYQLAN